MKAIRESLAIRRELARAPGQTQADRRALAATLGNIGNRLDDLGREPDALASYEECRTIFESLARPSSRAMTGTRATWPAP